MVYEGFYGEIPLCKGVYATASSLEECRNELESVLEDWILLRIHHGLEIPSINDIQLKVTKEDMAYA